MSAPYMKIEETHTRTVKRVFSQEEVKTILQNIVAVEAKMAKNTGSAGTPVRLYDNVQARVDYDFYEDVDERGFQFTVHLTQDMLEEPLLPEADKCGH